MALDEAVRVLFYEFTQLGIPPSEWVRWSIDAVEFYWDERLKRDEDMSDQIRSHQRASAAAKVAPRIYYSIPVR